MTPNELIILNYEEMRRRSIKLWNGIPEKFYHWQPDKDAMSLIETVRHVLESPYIYQQIIKGRGDKGNLISPLGGPTIYHHCRRNFICAAIPGRLP